MANQRKIKSQDDPDSISSTFIKNESFLRRFLKRFLSCPQDIEDVVQDTYLKARSAEESSVIYSPKAFLFRVARNQALKELRKKSRRITDYIEDLDSPGVSSTESSAEDESIARERLGIFCQSVLEMTPNCRRVFLMCKVYGMSYKDIAAQLGISVSGVEKHVARGLMICKNHVERMETPNVSCQKGVEYPVIDLDTVIKGATDVTDAVFAPGKRSRNVP